MNIRPYIVEVLGTPEAGKTTTIKEVISSLSNKGYNVQYVRESAEIVPGDFPKGSLDAHFWMRLHTAQSLLLASTSNADLVIVDRGIFDTLFWDYLYCVQGKLSEEQRNAANTFFLSFGYLPELVMIFTTSPEEAIIRRGGEGRIVTKKFIEEYNATLKGFCETQIDISKYEIDTTGMSVEAVVSYVESTILRNFSNGKQLP